MRQRRVPADDFARAACIDNSVCDLVEDSVSQLGQVFHEHAFRFRSLRFPGDSLPRLEVTSDRCSA